MKRFMLSWRAGLWLMLLPYLAGTLLLVGLPAALSAVLAFTTYDALTPPVFVGFANFRLLAADPIVTTAIGNSLFFILLAVPLRILGALGLALLLQRPRRGVAAYRAAAYLPTVIPDVAFALIWLWIFNPLVRPAEPGAWRPGASGTGLAGRCPARPASRSSSWRRSRSGRASWCCWRRCVGCLASTTTQARSMAPAAGRSFRYLTVPLLLPWLALLTFRDVVLSFQWTFAPSYVMTGGDPYYSTLFVPLLTYEEAFDRFRFGAGSALMLVTFVLSAAIIGAIYLLFRRRGYVADA